ncbi:TPA: hypothetical protein QEK98_002952 [Stenotrophomonas maltophilia]|nr:hypothetical protein [Stenotrophomonas maltophilia]
MTTDNKTLADVKPGGMVRLKDALPPLPPEVDAVRCMIRGEKDLAEACDYYYTAEQMRDYARAALSAQPSPGGQGDAHALASSMREIADKISSESNMAASQWVSRCNDLVAAAVLLESLAARQPVGEPVIWVSPGQLAAHKDRVPGDGGAYLPARLTRDGQFTKPLYATPAQAVDLGQFRRAVRWAVVNAVTEDFKNYAEGLLALIDSHTAGGQP